MTIFSQKTLIPLPHHMVLHELEPIRHDVLDAEETMLTVSSHYGYVAPCVSGGLGVVHFQ